MVRRNFLKKAAITTGGLLLHNTLSEAVSLPFKTKKINIAIIGCGDRGTGLMHVLKELNDLYQIKAICDVLEFRLDNARKIAPSALVFKDYRKLLDNKEIDAVIIAVPLYLHFLLAKDALQAGKHIYLEKTMTFNIPQALELVSLAKNKPDQVLQVGHQYRYTPLYFKVKDMISKGYLGKVTQIDCRWDRNGNWRRPVPDPKLERQINWRMYREYSGGLPAELLSHQIDFINWAFDTHASSIYSTGGIDFYPDGRETYDNVQAVLRYEKDHMIGNFGATCANSHDGYLFKIKGSKGMIALLVDEGIYYPEKETVKHYQTVDGVTGATKISWNKDGGIPILTEPIKDGSWYALSDFHKSINNRKIPVSNVITGAKTAINVHMINNSLFGKKIENWLSDYDL